MQISTPSYSSTKLLQQICSVLIVLVFLFPGFYFSQTTKSTFNASYWNAYADKLQLSGKDREEFISSHRRQNSQAPVSLAIPQSGQSPFAQKTFTQTNNTMAGPCVNADFEQGTLNGWVCTSGYNPGFNAIGCCTTVGGQQAIMSGAGTDPYGGFPIVEPSGLFSLRLGDNVNGGFADRIEQTFLVSPANANFSYKYAVVLEDPNHPIVQQPSFQVEMVDTLNQQIPCTYFYVAAGQNIPGFFNSATPGVIYKPWTVVLLDLTPYIGQNLTIRFTTFDCSLGGHFGYAYIDGVCQSFIGGGSATVCAGSTNTFCAPNGLASYMWNGPSVTNYIGQCLPATAPGVYTVQTTLFSNCGGPSFTYTLSTQPSPTASAGPNQTVCANNNLVTLSGSITGFTSTPQWSSSGSGIFSSPTNLNTTYTPSAPDIAAGSVTLTLSTLNNGVCPPATSSMQVIILPSPTVSAGNNQTICATASAALSGTVTGATNTGSWSSTGSGTFSPSPTILNPTYSPSAADIAAGSVTLTLTSTNNQGCFAGTGSVVVFIQNPPIANAGINPTVCANNSTVILSGSISGFPALPLWSSSGSGIFSSPTNLNTNYIPSAADIAAGLITLSLTTTNNGVCPASMSTVLLQITAAPIVSAGANQTVCSISSVALNGNVSGPTSTGFWSTSGSGGFSPSPNLPITNYVLSAADIALGNITFTLTSTGNGNCIAVTSTISVAISKIATVTAGANQALCSTASTLALSGNVSGVTSTGFWTSSGTGAYNPSAGSLSNTYFLSLTDIANGSVIFTLSSTNNGPCPSVIDTVMIKIVQLALVNAGTDQLICESQGLVSLSGTALPSGGSWTSTGTGNFSPSSFSLTPTYAITAADIAAGSVTFTLSSTGNGPCPTVRDSVKVNIRKLAQVNAGANIQLCSTSPSVSLSGSVSVGTASGLWTSMGTGNFLPSPTLLNTSYIYSANDLSVGSVTLVLTSINNGVCPAVSDSLVLKLFKDPVIDLKSDTTVCSYQNPISISAGLSGNFGNVLWTSSGNGTFIPTNATNPIKYKFGSNELNTGVLTLSISLLNNGPCANKSGVINITIHPTPIAAFSASSYTLTSIKDPVAFTNNSQQATIYYWTFGDGNSSNQTNPSHTYAGAGFYNVVLIASNQYNCSDTAGAQIVIKSTIQFPNAFTPNTGGTNGGGYDPNNPNNQVFFPFTSGVKEDGYDLKVFNRYGELIFQTTDLKVGWDGYFNGKLCQQDAYVWKANITFFDGTVFNKVGSVTLLR